MLHFTPRRCSGSQMTSLSLYGEVVGIWNNTPNTPNTTRARVAQCSAPQSDDITLIVLRRVGG